MARVAIFRTEITQHEGRHYRRRNASLARPMRDALLTRSTVPATRQTATTGGVFTSSITRVVHSKIEDHTAVQSGGIA